MYDLNATKINANCIDYMLSIKWNKNRKKYRNLNDVLTVFGFFDLFPFFPFNLLVGVSLRLRDVVSVFVVLDRLITSSFIPRDKRMKNASIAFALQWWELTFSSPEQKAKWSVLSELSSIT